MRWTGFFYRTCGAPLDRDPHQAVWHIVNNGYRPAGIVLNALNPLFAGIGSPSRNFPLGYIVQGAEVD